MSISKEKLIELKSQVMARHRQYQSDIRKEMAAKAEQIRQKSIRDHMDIVEPVGHHPICNFKGRRIEECPQCPILWKQVPAVGWTPKPEMQTVVGSTAPYFEAAPDEANLSLEPDLDNVDADWFYRL